MEIKRQKPPRFGAIKKRFPKAYADWTAEEDAQLRRELDAGTPIADIARAMGRRPSAVRSRRARLTG
jgi:hypothetical protein